MYKQYRRYRRFLVLADLILTVAVFALIVELRPYLPGRIVDSLEAYHAPQIYLTVLLLWHVLFATSGVYELSRLPYFTKQLGIFTSSYCLAVFIFAGFLYFTFRDVSRMLVVYFSITNYFVLLLLRFALTVYLAKKSWGMDRTPVLVVGVTDNGLHAAQTINAHHSSVYSVIGFADDDPPADQALPAPVIGTLADVPRLVKEHRIELVMIALPENRSVEAERLIMDLYGLPVRIYVVPDLFKLTLLQSEIETFGDLMVIGIREPAIEGFRRVAKRVFDLVASSILLLLTWPLFAVITLAIKLDSPGPIVYRARRVGENGKIFEMLKFRSMVVGAESLQVRVVRTDEQGREVFKSQGDPRVTRVGKILRRTSLDELPQLINVFKGEMSLVGPRPEQPFITEQYEYWQWARLAVPPGITGWWQVSGRSDLPMHLNTQYDLFYVRNYSFLLDLKILLKTVGVVIRGKGAY
jgi:exopolysaccharide biosynthesis polyprenyl glycosylphosphotransferase